MDMTNVQENQQFPHTGEGITVNTWLALERVGELGKRRARAEVLAPALAGYGYLGTFTFSL